MKKSFLKLCLAGTIALSVGSSALADSLVGDYVQDNQLRILNDFKEFLSLQNTGAAPGMQQRNADWIIDYISKRGFKAQSVTAGGEPYVIAERLTEGASKTVLFYVH